MKFILVVCLLLATSLLNAQMIIQGTVIDSKRNIPLDGAMVQTQDAKSSALSDERGVFTISLQDSTVNLIVSSVGYHTQTISITGLKNADRQVLLMPNDIQLSEVKITGMAGEQYQSVSKLDIAMRGINNSQEILRMVPGLFIGQHAGGGKAEQIFLRGFDIDHGTDINIAVDGMPVNMVSHAHGQGYADLHFLIPELIDHVNFKKGPYYAEKGNFTTTGFVDFKTLNSLDHNQVKVEGGMFNTWRGLGLFNILNEKARQKSQNAFVAAEYMHTKGYFDSPQHFNRINLFGKYNGKLNSNNTLTASGSYFASKWKASGQIPDRAVEAGLIGFYGAIDPNEGGLTGRGNANLSLLTTLNDGSYFKNQVYFSHYEFELFSNFTFFKEDPVNGDQIRQRENRNLYGYNGSYNRIFNTKTLQIKSETGVQVRNDQTKNSELSRTKDRTTVTEPIMLGDISELNIAAYQNLTFIPSAQFNMNVGLRYDHFSNAYTDHFNNDERGNAKAGIVSPKLSFNYHPSSSIQVYLSGGKGFHSNDTRVVVPQRGLRILPAAYGSDLGTVWKPAKSLLVQAAIWYLWLDQEFVYVGDEGIVEPGGKTRRIGTDLSIRYQPLSWLYADVDFNYSHARAVEEAKGEDRIPLAPRVTSIGGLTIKTNKHISFSARYRYMGDRPANEDNSVIAKGYFVADAFINYSREKFDVNLTVQNVANVKWKETQFDTESRLFYEPSPVSEIHFTPGTPFSARLGFTYRF
ncbi:TonB-dependent receptor [Terrimonas ferruginea]|uniref:TonB-dependent receptor n=1 Tax=Terrimonas ferruginea TaxID=249 RepID=UPI0004152D45|nr:TonB-dependent receptor [Terrimonas ferruginea]